MLDVFKITLMLLPLSHIFTFVFAAVFQNVIYAVILMFVAKILSDQGDLSIFEGQSFLDTLPYESGFLVSLLVFTYIFASLFIFVYQTYLSNRVMSKLSHETVKLYDYSTVLSGGGMNSSELIKDSTSEIPRIANNVINPLLEAIKNLITTGIIIFTILIISPTVILAILAILSFYLFFWIGTQALFKKMAIRISKSLYDRQRSAEYLFQSIYDSDRQKFSYNYPADLFLGAVKNLVSLNVRSKSIAYLPRLFIEATVLAMIFFGGTSVGNNAGTLVLLGMAALRVLPSVQGLSAAISNIQTNLFAAISYAERLQLLKDNRSSSGAPKSNKFPKNLPSGTYLAKFSDIKFTLRSKLCFPPEGIVLLKGPSGIGKSTFLRIIAGLERGVFDTTETFAPGCSDVDFVQQGDIPMRGTVIENLFGCSNIQLLDLQSDKYTAAQAYYAILFQDDNPHGLKDILYYEFGRNSGLSGGEIRRLLLIKSLCSGTNVLVWDEPFDGIQLDLVNKLLNNLTTLSNRRIFIIDHNIIDTAKVTKVMSFDVVSNNIIIELN